SRLPQPVPLTRAGSLLAVAVRAAHVALLKFRGSEAGATTALNEPTDIFRLPAAVVELQHQRICDAAVLTCRRLEALQYQCRTPLVCARRHAGEFSLVPP